MSEPEARGPEEHEARGPASVESAKETLNK
jgi:hypothetical protein